MIYVIYYPVPITGHIAIVLTGLKKSKKEDRTNVHISFYPEVKQSKTLFRLHSFKNDGTDVSHIIALPSEESCGKGLSEKAIYEWWEKEFKPQTTAYGLINNNCSSFVYRALIEGQDHSETLGKNRLLEKGWFCSPNNVMQYAKQLSDILMDNLNKDQSLLADLMQTRDLTQLEKVIPYDLAMAMYYQIKQSENEDINMLKLPYCKAIKKALKAFRLSIPDQVGRDLEKRLLAKTELSDAEEYDFDKSFAKLRELTELVYEQDTQLIGLLQTAIKDNLLTHMSRIIENLSKPDFSNSERIKRTMSFLGHKVNDDLNPQKEYFLSGTKSDLGWWVRMLGH